MSKKTIGLITDWFPTKENPYAGVFFKDQALVTSDYFEFVVIRYKEKKKNLAFVYALKFFRRKWYSLQKINEEKNIIEYELIVEYPAYLWIMNFIHNAYTKMRYGESIPGVGAYISSAYKKNKKKKIGTIFNRHFKDEIDALYCVDAQKESSTLMFASAVLGCPYIIGEHAPVPWPGSVISDLEHMAMEHADAFIAISHDKIRQMLLQNIRLKKIIYIGNLIDEDQFHLKTSCNEIKTFLIVAAHSFYKNYGMFVDVMNRLTEIANTPFNVMIVGYGSNKGYSSQIQEFENQIKKTKFADKVQMIPEVRHNEIQNIYWQADAFVMTSIQEGQPVSVMEAACCGLPIFSTRCGGVEDYIDDRIGRLFNINDVDSFAESLNDYLQGSISFDSNLIRQSVVEKFGKKAFRNNFVTIFLNEIESNNR